MKNPQGERSGERVGQTMSLRLKINLTGNIRFNFSIDSCEMLSHLVETKFVLDLYCDDVTQLQSTVRARRCFSSKEKATPGRIVTFSLCTER